MKKKARKALTVTLIASVIVIATLVVSLNTLIHKNRDGIQEEIQKALGRSISFDRVRLDLWGGLGLSAKNLRIADDPRFAATPLVQTKELKMQVRWLPLFLGKIEIKKFVLGEPEIQIIRSEAGDLNILALGRSDGKENGKREVRKPKERSPMSFFISGVQVSQGKVHYVDRSSKQPVEVRLQNLDLDLRGLGLTGVAKIDLAANLLDGQEQNLMLKGRIGPLTSFKDWTQFPLNLRVEIGSLPLPRLTQAVPFLKEKIPSYLNITGPLTLKARLQGTIDHPRINGLNLTGAFFGSPSNNVNLTGDLDFSKGGFTRGAAIKGKIIVEPVTLDHLKKIPFVEQILPTSLTSNGPLGLESEVEGSLLNLSVHTLLDANKSEIGYGKWFKKPKDVPGQIEISAVQKKDGLFLKKSTLSLHNLKLEFSGWLKERPERLLNMRIRTDSVDLSGWDRLLVPISSYDMAGKMGFNLSIEKVFTPRGDNWSVRGALNLNELRAKDKKNGRSIEGITSRITFRGKEARIENLRLRVGSSLLHIQGVLRNPSNPTFRYNLRSPKLNLVDLTNRTDHKPYWMKNLTSAGEFQLKNGRPSVQARLTLGEGHLQEISTRNLKGEIAWRPDSLGIKSLAFQAMGGSLRGSGNWKKENGRKPRFSFHPTIENMELKTLLARLSPEFSDQVDGSVSLQAKLSGWGEDWATIKQSLQGEGRAEVQGGSLKNFNLIEGVLSRVTGLPGISNLISSRLPSRYAAIFKRQDTPFDTIETSFNIGNGQVGIKNLLLATPDYMIQGNGRIGYDKTIRWKATLATSPELTRELMKNHRNVRYLVDGQGRLGVPFKLGGTLPHVRPKPDTKRLARLIQKGLLRKGLERALKGKKSKKKNRPQDWILKGLEQLLGK